MNYNYMLYYSATTATKTAAPYPINGYLLSTSGTSGPIPSTPTVSTTTAFCAYSPTPSVSSNVNVSGASTGIVWAIENQTGRDDTNDTCDKSPPPDLPAALHAFNATTLQELYSSRTVATKIGSAVGFPTPTIFQGQVYMGTNLGGAQNNLPAVDVFGLCGSPSRCKQ